MKSDKIQGYEDSVNTRGYDYSVNTESKNVYNQQKIFNNSLNFGTIKINEGKDDECFHYKPNTEMS